jgi:RNA polymerase sigma-70 factor, ECF subfamily
MVENSRRYQRLAALPSLRGFAISLTGNRDRADDLVQDAILRAWANLDRFERGTNLNAWPFMILRNRFHSEYRMRKREVEDADGAYAARLKTHPDQQTRLDFDDFRAALTTLPLDQREALLLVGAGCATKKLLRCAKWRSARSKAASTVLGLSWPTFWTSRVRPTSVLTM